ncbi:MAG: lipopolysaccharide biosynthesis protein, partial [Lachnospiraceae bacterium]|nr:lipopolysaccharide biosynthesis protein [Lachnospiraceae bacterium]
MKQNYRRDLVLNSLAGLTNAAEAIVLSIITVRIGRLSDAGVLSLAFAAGNVLLTIALFGGKLFQASDVKHVFSFRTYLYQRLITILCMSAVLGGILFFAGYSREKALAVLLIALIYMIEAVEDCFWGRLQLKGKLYLGAVMFISRWWCIMLIYLAAVSYSRDMVTALIAACIAGFVIFLGWCIYFAGAGRKMLTDEDA